MPDTSDAVARPGLLEQAAARLEARGAALLEGLDDLAVFVAKARQSDARVWQEAAQELRRLAEHLAPAPALRDILAAWCRAHDLDDIAEEESLNSLVGVVQPLVGEATARAEAMERAMEETAADALKHRGCHRELMGQVCRAETAEAEVARLTDLMGRYADRGIANGQRAEQAEAALTRVRNLHDRLTASDGLTDPEDCITRSAAARRISAALDGWTPPADQPDTGGAR